MPIRTGGAYLQRWGVTPQKPVKHAYEQRPAAVQNWLNEEYVAMAQRAKQEQAEIHCGDETGIRSDWQHGRSYAPKGKTPVIRLSTKRTSVNMLSTVLHETVDQGGWEEEFSAEIICESITPSLSKNGWTSTSSYLALLSAVVFTRVESG